MAKVDLPGTFANENEEYQCPNCEETWELGELKPIEDIFQRVAPGEPMPAGECPLCGALCHLRETAATADERVKDALHIVDMNRNSPIKVRAAALDIIGQILRGKA